MRAVLPAVSALWAILLLLPASSALATPGVGQPAPALAVPELDGQAFDLGALRGKVVVLNFWATWCPPCRKEMPALDAFYRRYRGRGLAMIGLSVDRPRDRADVRKVMQSFSFPAAMLDDATVDGFGTPNALPVTFVVDANGIVRARITPEETPLTEKTLSDAVVPLLPREAATPSPRGRGHSRPVASP